jgi:hypothetical protein
MGVREWLIRREADGFEKEHAMQWQAIKDWLNAEPGRKRGIGAALLGIAAAADALGHTDVAEGVRAVNVAVQTVQVTTALSGVLMAGWGWIQAHRQGRA